AREIFEETGLKTKIIDFLNVYSDPDRDPRGHTITLAYLLEEINGKLKGGDDASEARFFDLDNLPDLAFDHDKIIRDALRRNK
ncbi:MAG TPA: NUDIX hydrolase, partial [Bacteroidetes bacterium]|nr:NUDIX hydrolase [Bacteroidota bacterium]